MDFCNSVYKLNGALFYLKDKMCFHMQTSEKYRFREVYVDRFLG